jgi:hypothetical protein
MADCRTAALEAGCHAGFDSANAAYAAFYAVKTAVTLDEAVEHAPKPVLYAAEAAVEAATHSTLEVKVRRELLHQWAVKSGACFESRPVERSRSFLVFEVTAGG